MRDISDHWEGRPYIGDIQGHAGPPEEEERYFSNVNTVTRSYDSDLAQEVPYTSFEKAQDLKQVIGKKIKDTFEAGDVIRFVAYKHYRYAAIKGDNDKWYTTAVRGSIPKTLTFNELINVLRSSDVEDIELASEFISIA